MSRRPISTKRPPGARHDRLDSMKPGPVRPVQPPRRHHCLRWLPAPWPNSVVRLSKTCSTSRDRRKACLGALAVANTSAPAARAQLNSREPRPPEAVWTRHTVALIQAGHLEGQFGADEGVGNGAQCSRRKALQAPGAAMSARVTRSGRKVPIPNPNTRSPTLNWETSGPTSVIRPQNSSPRVESFRRHPR